MTRARPSASPHGEPQSRPAQQPLTAGQPRHCPHATHAAIELSMDVAAFPENEVPVSCSLVARSHYTPTFAIKQSYIVYLGAQTHGLNPTSVDLDAVTNSHYELLGSFVGSTSVARDKIFYSYTRNINGFAAILDEKEAAAIAKHPQVVSVFVNKGRKLHTTRSWDFMRLERDGVIPNNSLWKKSNFGADVIIGNLDTGVWPESKSFSDHGMGEIPLKWRGLCHIDTKDGVVCNRKLIGGASLSAAILKSRTSYPLITGEQAKVAGASVEDATLCQPGSIDPKKAKGKILVCVRGVNPRTDKGKQALLAGAVGMILANDEQSVPELKGKVTVSRTVKNVGPPRSTYKVRVRSPPGITITVNPSILKFKKSDEEKSFKVTIKPNNDVESQDFVFGELLWSDGIHTVRSPIVVFH
ncbi:hypothetical protein V6N11_033024 [Hibiscus sabdariffa]|uniref:Subtilisin-like protease SBT5.3 n=1 Tax=Hibiscus sabdariffa TaxID=183260 RepID=A0ABR2A046_9ROSI